MNKNVILEKIKILFVPFVISYIAFVSLYNFVYWVFCIKNEYFSIPSYDFEVLIPIIPVFVFVFIFLRPRIKLLKFKNDKSEDVCHAIALIGFFTTAMIIQSYIETCNYTLTKIENISQINNFPKTKCYQIKNFYLDTTKTKIYSYDDNYRRKGHPGGFFITYYAMPIRNNIEKNDTTIYAWLTDSYKEEVSSMVNSVERPKEFESFLQRSSRLSMQYFKFFKYLEVLDERQDKNAYYYAINEIQKNPIFFKRVNEPFEDRNGRSFEWIFYSFLIATFCWIIAIFATDFDKKKLKDFKNKAKN